MEIHMARRDTAMKRYRQVRPTLRLGAAIAEASKKLTGLSPSKFEAIIRSKKAVLLNGVDWESVYLMFYSVPRGRIYIAVASAADEAHQDGQPVVADILTVEDYELKGGVVDMNSLRRSVTTTNARGHACSFTTKSQTARSVPATSNAPQSVRRTSMSSVWKTASAIRGLKNG